MEIPLLHPFVAVGTLEVGRLEARPWSSLLPSLFFFLRQLWDIVFPLLCRAVEPPSMESRDTRLLLYLNLCCRRNLGRYGTSHRERSRGNIFPLFSLSLVLFFFSSGPREREIGFYDFARLTRDTASLSPRRVIRKWNNVPLRNKGLPDRAPCRIVWDFSCDSDS